MIRSLIALICLVNARADVIVSLRAIELSREIAEHVTNAPEKSYTIAVQALKDQHAKEVETLLLAGHENYFLKSESIAELIFPTDFIAEELPETKREPDHKTTALANRSISYLDFAVRSTGTTFQAKVSRAEEASFLLDIEYSHVALDCWIKFPHQHDEPYFLSRNMKSTLTIPQSTWQFIGFRDAWRAESPDGAKVAFFVRVDPLR